MRCHRARDIGELLLDHVPYVILRVGGQSELRVGENHAVPFLVPYLGKRLLPFPGRETCLAGIEQAVVGVGFPVGLCDVMDVGDDKGLPDLPEAAHLMRGHLHDHLI